MAQIHFKMHFHPPVGHECQEMIKVRNLLVRMLFLIVWPNLHNNFLFECLSISAKYIYQLNDRLLFMFKQLILIFYPPSNMVPQMAANPMKNTVIRRY